MRAFDAAEEQQQKGFGTFTGVFTPTLLTILGVIIRPPPWVVGNSGLLGAWLIMGIAMAITACTGLSLSSIATNTRLGAGGPYAIISKSLGFEVGGAIGLPLFLSRPLGVAMYVFGFREGWLWLFPSHNALVVDLAVFGVLVGIAYVSADLAFRVQYAIMGIIVLSIGMIVMSPLTWQPEGEMVLWGEFPGFPEKEFEGGVSFWEVFAVFFPATTGILAGANMSGDLRDPRRSIPRGTLWAIGLSSVIYFALAWWAARAGNTYELVSNYTFFIDESSWAPGVLLGLLGATFSSALASLVGGPRILAAMGQHRILPYSEWLAQTSSGGEPRNATVLTAILTLGCLMMRDLNAIAPLVTMFFLITYFMINVVLLLENGLGLVSFRPTLRVPSAIPLIGALGCVYTMFIVNPIFSLISVGTVLGLYTWMVRREVEGHGEDVRSSVFVAVAEWAAARVTEFDKDNVRAWKPTMLIPVEDPTQLRGEFQFLHDLTYPEGSVKLLGLATETTTVQELKPRISRLANAFRKKDVFASWSIIGSADFTTGIVTGLQALQGAFFRPNLLFMSVPEDPSRFDEFSNVIRQARDTQVGVLMLGVHRRAGFGRCKVVNLWVRPQPLDEDLQTVFGRGNLNLLLLMGYRLMKSWEAEVNLITVVDTQEEQADYEQFLKRIKKLARLPRTVKTQVMVGEFGDCVSRAPQSDLDLMGIHPTPDFAFMLEMIELTRSSCLFVWDSGRESALV